MKKILSVLVAMMMVLSTLVTAAPLAVIGFDAASENLGTNEITAGLSGEITLSSQTNLISVRGGSITVTASEDTSFDVDVGLTGASYSATSNTVTVTAPDSLADGVVKIVAGNAQKNIYIKIDDTKQICDTRFDFSSQGDFLAQNSAAVTFNGNTANITNSSGYLGLEGKDRGIDTDTYPYMCFVAKADTAADSSVQIYLNTSNVNYSNKEERSFKSTLNLTTEYKTFVYDIREIGLSGQFGGMMFCNRGSGNIEIDEIYFASYDPTAATYALSLEADKYEITSDSDFVTLSIEFFSDGDDITNKEIIYTFDQKMVTVMKNNDGTATVTALKNGECTVSATSEIDSTSTSSVTLNISEVTPKAISRDIHYYALGNSYMEYSPSTSGFVGWWMSHGKDEDGNYVENYENRGMAASKAEYDYFHRIGAGLKETYNGSFKSAKFNVASAERSWQVGGTVVETYDYDAALVAVEEAYAPMVEYLKTEKPNVITVQVQENTGLGISWAHQTIAEWYYRQLYTMIQENRPEDSIVVVIPPIDGGDGVSVTASAQAAVIDEFPGFYLASEISTFAPHDSTKQNLPVTTNYIGVPDYKYTNPHLAYMQYSEYDEEILSGRETVEFRAHPSDYGFQRMAEVVLPIMYEHIPTIISGTEVLIPESFDIEGLEAVSQETQYSVSNMAPSDAGTAVRWTVDNTELAKIDEDGNLTPKRNGTVVLTATSVYDENVYAEKTVEITGMAPHYTITYDAGTSDSTVKNIPASYAYAAEEYVFPAATPTRDGYKFGGWSETKGGSAIASVYMDSDKTVYAVWTFATDWQFNTDGDLEGISMGGMHGKAEDGVATAITYNSGAASVYADKLAIPAALYGTFTASIGFTEIEDGDKLILTIGTKESDENYTFEAEITTNALTEYTFDISRVEGTIDYFMAATSNEDIVTNKITVDYITFVRTPMSGNVSYDVYDAAKDEEISSGNYCVSYNTLTINPDVTVELGAGNYVIGNLVNNGTLIASPSANVIITGEGKPQTYVEIDLGDRDGDSNIRYAEIGGIQTRIAEYNNLYGIIADVNTLVEITEKSYDASSTVVATRYYFVNAEENTAKEIESLASFMDNLNEKSMRLPDEKTENYLGLRFMSYINPNVKQNVSDYEITEYGYIVARSSEEELTFDSSRKYVTGIAYNAEQGIDKIYSSEDDNKHLLAGVFYGVPNNANAYEAELDAKMYAKINIEGEEFVVYSEKMTFSAYSIAMAVKDTEMSDDMKAAVLRVIDRVESAKKEIYIDFKDLLG